MNDNANTVLPKWLSITILDEERGRHAKKIRVEAEQNHSWFDSINNIDERYLPALGKFLFERPYKYFNTEVASLYYSILNQAPERTIKALEEYSDQITHAFQVLERQADNASEADIEVKKPSNYLEAEQVWHPEYQTRVEHVMQPFLRVALKVLSARKPPKHKRKTNRPLKKRGSVTYDNISLGAIHQPIKSYGFEKLVATLNTQVRNAIAHGTVRFSEHTIVYMQENRHPVELWGSQLARLIDGSADAVHAMAVAICVFCGTRATLDASVEVKFPVGVKFCFAKAYSKSINSSIDAVVETDHHESSKGRLHVFCTAGSRVREVYIYSTLRLAFSLLAFGFSEYEDYWFSVEVGEGVPASFGIRLDKLATARGGPVEGLLEFPLLWHDGSRFERYRFSIQHSFSAAFSKFTEIMKDAIEDKAFAIRDIRNISVESLRRIQAHVVLLDSGISIDDLADHIENLIARLKWHLVRAMKYKEKGIPRRVSHMYVTVHTSDARVRELRTRGNLNPHVLLWFEWPRPNQIFPLYAHWRVGPAETFAHVNRKSALFSRLFSHLDDGENQA